MESAAPPPVRLAVAGMIAMAVAMGIGRFVYTPILPGMMEELGLSAAQAGWIASANYLGYLAGALVAAGGWVHGHDRRLVLAGLGGTVVLCAAMGLTQSMAAFLAIRFVAGLASSFVMVFMANIVFSHLRAAGRDELQALHFGGVGLGISLSAALMALLVADHATWTSGWYWSAALSLCGFAVVAMLVNHGPAGSGVARGEPPLPKNRALGRVIFAYGLFGFGYVVTATFLITIVRQGGGSRTFEAMVWLVTGLSGAFSVWVWQKASAKIGLYGAYAASCLIEAVGVTASVALGGHVGPLIGGALLGITFLGATALGLQAGRVLAPQAMRRLFALMTASFGVGQIAGPIVAGYLAQWTGSFFAPSILAGLVLVASGLIVWSVRKATPVPA